MKRFIDGKLSEYIAGGVVGSPIVFDNEKEYSMKSDINNVVYNYLTLHGFTKRSLFAYNAKVVLMAFEIVRNHTYLTTEMFRFIIENLPFVDEEHEFMLKKVKDLYLKYCGVVDGEQILVTDFVKDLFEWWKTKNPTTTEDIVKEFDIKPHVLLGSFSVSKELLDLVEFEQQIVTNLIYDRDK